MNLTLPVRKNLELRALTLSDAQTLFDATKKNRVHLREWLPWLDDDMAVADTKKYIKGSIERLSKGEGIDLLIWFNDQLIGGIGIDPLDKHHKKTSIGYWLVEEFQSQGIMNDSLKVVIAYLFKEKNLNRIEVCCAIGNKKSSSLPKKLGFTYEGISRESEWLYDHFVDMEVYSLLTKEWKK